MRISRVLALCAVLSGATVPGATAQTGCHEALDCPTVVPGPTTLAEELTLAGVNAALGGATAAVFRLARGEPLADALAAFWTGAAGGSLTYAGKRVAVERFRGAGLVGRPLASVGGSMVSNASAGRAPLSRLVFPVGPVRVYAGSATAPRITLDVATVVASAVFIGVYDARLDPGASLSSGSLVFRGRGSSPGLTSAGATLVWSDMPASEGPRLLAHERVHVLQYDQAFLSWGEPLERWALRPGPDAGLWRHVDLGVAAVGLRAGLGYAFDYRARPWEREAYWLARRAYPIGAGSD
jgi:hypothetical protein